MQKFCAVLILLCCPSLTWAGFRFAFDTDQNRWTLNNGAIEAVFQLTPSGTFEFQSLTGLHGEGNWNQSVATASSPIRFTLDGNYFNETTRYSLLRQTAQAVGSASYRQLIVLRDSGSSVDISLELIMYQDQPVLRYRVSVRNLQAQPVTATLADLLSWTFSDSAATYRVFRVNQWYPAQIPTDFQPLQDVLDPEGPAISLQSGSGASQCAWMAVSDASGRGLFAGWEFDGTATASAQQSTAADALHLSALIDGLHHPVAPGDTFQMPAAFIGLFQGDWDEAGYRTQLFANAALAAPPPDSSIFPYVGWDSWGYQQAVDETILQRNADLAAKLGMELFVVDLGWARSLGDWHEDPSKFPTGLRSLSDYVHSLGMKFGLHFAFAEASPEAPVLQQNPDWAASDTSDYFGAQSLCLSNAPARAWIVQEAIQMIDTYNIDWILQDGANMVKKCTKATHTHDPADSNYSNAVDGFNSVVAAIQQARPNVSWENCSNGGTVMTFNMVQHYATSITNDASGDFDSRSAAFGATYPFPPRYADRYMVGQTLDKFRTRSYMFGGPWMFMERLIEVTPNDQALAASEIAIFKSMRGTVRSGEVFHISPPAKNSIDAIQSFNASQRVAIAVVTRDGGDADSYTLFFRGLDSSLSYRVTFQEDARVLTLSGLQLMQSGVNVALPGAQFSEIVFATPVDSPLGTPGN